MPIYVEARIRGDMEELWRRTQTPALHERWDLRFTSITYLDRAGEGEPQRFRYATRIGFGMEVEGWGETAGRCEADGSRTSALKFGSHDRRSLIRSGSGYWKYEQIGDVLRFATGYDYDVRWGVIGRVLDRLMFRPLMGWATAWSFDRLRLWIEEGLDPRRAARQAMIHALAACTVAFVWMWHGIVPKLAGPHPDELAMLAAAGLPQDWLEPVTLLIGIAELGLGLAFVPFARSRWPWVLTLVLMGVATLGTLASSPQRALAAFNPITLNLLLAALAGVGLLSLGDSPSARRCRRTPQKPGTENRV